MAVILGYHGYDLASSGLDFLHIADGFLISMVRNRYHYSRHLGIDKSNRAMLHFRCGITFGMDVRNLLQLEGSFESRRIIVSTSEIDEIVGVGEDFCQISNLFVRIENFPYSLRQFKEGLCNLPAPFCRKRTLLPCNCKRHHCHDCHLSCESLCGSNPYLRPHVDICTGIRCTCYG